MQRRDRIVLQKIVSWIDDTMKIFPNVSKEEFLTDKLLERAMAIVTLQHTNMKLCLLKEFT